MRLLPVALLLATAAAGFGAPAREGDATEANPSGGKTLVLGNEALRYDLTPYVSVLRLGADENLTVEEVSGPGAARRFAPLAKTRPGLTGARETWWLRFRLSRSLTDRRYGLIPGFWTVRSMRLYEPVGPRQWREAARPSPPVRAILLEVPAAAKGEPPWATFFLRMEEPVLLHGSLELLDQDLVPESRRRSLVLVGCFYGILVTLFSLYLYFFFAVRDRSYLWYALYLTAVAWFFHGDDGLLDGVRGLESPQVRLRLTLIGLTMAMAFSALFTRSFTRASEDAPRIDRALRFMAGGAIVLAAATPFTPLATAHGLTIALALGGGGALCAIGLAQTLRGAPGGGLFAVAWALFVAGWSVRELALHGVAPLEAGWVEAGRWATAAQSVMLAFAAGHEIRGLRRQRDAAEQARLEAEHASSLQSLILDNSLLGIVFVRRGVIEWANPGFAEMMRLEENDIVDAPTLTFSKPDASDDPFQSGAREITEGEQVCMREKELMRGDGSRFWCRFIGRAVNIERPEAGCVWMLEDITERKRANEATERQSDELARSNAELERFAYVASHDLREPLRSIAGYLQLLERRCADAVDERGRGYIARSVAAAERMGALIENLLDYSRVTSSKQPFETVDLSKIAEQVAEDLREIIEEARAEIAWGDLPTVQGDAVQLRRLLQNLLSNALKFRTEEPPRIEVSARPLDTGAAAPSGHELRNAWVFTVSDNGIGIPEERLEDVFQIFRRLHTSREYPGAGVGLAVCKRIVENHGGRIWVESDPGRGSRFRFVLSAV